VPKKILLASLWPHGKPQYAFKLLHFIIIHFEVFFKQLQPQFNREKELEAKLRLLNAFCDWTNSKMVVRTNTLTLWTKIHNVYQCYANIILFFYQCLHGFNNNHRTLVLEYFPLVNLFPLVFNFKSSSDKMDKYSLKWSLELEVYPCDTGKSDLGWDTPKKPAVISQNVKLGSTIHFCSMTPTLRMQKKLCKVIF